MADKVYGPPRYVPTLTEVVQDGPWIPAASPSPEPPTGTTSLGATEVSASRVALGLTPPDLASQGVVAPSIAAALTGLQAYGIQEELLHRILQRVDLSLEAALEVAVQNATQQHLDALMPQLRLQIESAVRRVVVEAVAQELSQKSGSLGGNAGPALG